MLSVVIPAVCAATNRRRSPCTCQKEGRRRVANNVWGSVPTAVALRRPQRTLALALEGETCPDTDNQLEKILIAATVAGIDCV